MDYLQWSLGISREIKQRRILNTRLDVSEAPTFTEKRFSTGLALNGGRKIVKFLLLSSSIDPLAIYPPFTLTVVLLIKLITRGNLFNQVHRRNVFKFISTFNWLSASQ